MSFRVKSSEDAMTEKVSDHPKQHPTGNAEKDPDDWVTGDEPMTAPQRSYLDTLAREAGEEITADLTKAEASGEIDRLQHETGRTND